MQIPLQGYKDQEKPGKYETTKGIQETSSNWPQRNRDTQMTQIQNNFSLKSIQELKGVSYY